MKVHLVDIRKGEEDSSLRVAFGRRGRVVGEVQYPGDTDELEKFACVRQEEDLFVEAGLDDRGKLVDPVYLGFGRDGMEKVAEDPLTVATVKWQASGAKKKNIAPVLAELRRVVAGRAQDFSSRGGTAVPQAEFMKAGLKALRKYDPNKGARASTFVVSSLKEAHRPLLQRATPLRVPEHRLQQVGKVRRARAELEEKGTPAAVKDVARKAKVAKKDVALLEKEVQPIHMHSKEQVPHGDKGSQLKEVWGLLGPELAGNELKVYQTLNKRPQANNTAIAKQLGISASQVSRYRQNLRRRVLTHAKRG